MHSLICPHLLSIWMNLGSVSISLFTSSAKLPVDVTQFEMHSPAGANYKLKYTPNPILNLN